MSPYKDHTTQYCKMRSLSLFAFYHPQAYKYPTNSTSKTPIHKSNFFLPPHNFLSIFCENIFQYECYILFLIKLCLEVVLENFSEFLGAISQVYFPFVLWILQLCLAKTLCVLGCYGSNKCLVINSIFYHLNLRYLLEF